MNIMIMVPIISFQLLFLFAFEQKLLLKSFVIIMIIITILHRNGNILKLQYDWIKESDRAIEPRNAYHLMFQLNDDNGNNNFQNIQTTNVHKYCYGYCVCLSFESRNMSTIEKGWAWWNCWFGLHKQNFWSVWYDLLQLQIY